KGSAADLSMAAGGASVAGYTPHFAPLEQIRGSGTNPRSDLYSLAATLYFLLTGERPPDALERASALLGGRPDPLVPAAQRNPAIPAAVSNVLHVGMAQMPEHRWVSASAETSPGGSAVLLHGRDGSRKRIGSGITYEIDPRASGTEGPPVFWLDD